MTNTVAAVYQNGVLHPENPLPLADGAHVRLVVLPDAGPVPGAPARNPAAVRARIQAIAGLPVEPGPDFAGRDHDRILYGGPEGAE